MSAFQDMAAPAPQVEAAVANRAKADSDRWQAKPARPSESARVDAAASVGPAVTFDDPSKFAPPISAEVASNLSVATLRGGSGADFESKAAVIKGGVERNFLRCALPFIYDERDFVSFGEVARFVFLKGNCIFIYGQETDPSPLYAIQLETVVAILEDSKKKDKHSFTVSPQVNTNEARENLVTILLKDTHTRKQKYQITLDTSNDRSLAKRFLDSLTRNAKHYGGEVIVVSAVRAKVIGKALAK